MSSHQNNSKLDLSHFKNLINNINFDNDFNSKPHIFFRARFSDFGLARKTRMPLRKPMFSRAPALHCLSIAAVLPQYCCSIAAVLPQHCRRTAAVLP